MPDATAPAAGASVPHPMNMVRAFFALVPPPAVRAQLAARAGVLAASSRGRATTTPSIHLTLVFVGEVAMARVAELEAIGAAVKPPAFDLALDTAGGFRRTRVAWTAPAVTPPGLVTLQAALHEGIAAAGFRVEARPFRPHVTLARHCAAWLPVEPVPPVAWAVDRFELVASTLDPGGAHHRTLAAWPLRPEVPQATGTV